MSKQDFRECPRCQPLYPPLEQLHHHRRDFLKQCAATITSLASLGLAVNLDVLEEYGSRKKKPKRKKPGKKPPPAPVPGGPRHPPAPRDPQPTPPPNKKPEKKK